MMRISTNVSRSILAGSRYRKNLRCYDGMLRVVGKQQQQYAPAATTAVFPSSFSSSSSSSSNGTALVLGSSGALGSTVSQYMSRELGMQVLGADVVGPPSNDIDWELDGFIPVPPLSQKPSVADVTSSLVNGVHSFLGDDEYLDTIICAAGGWQPDDDTTNNPSSDVANELKEGSRRYGERIEEMMSVNLYPVLAAGYTAQQFMGNNGLFVAIGATAALSATPGMLGYGLSKSATHHFVQTLGASTGKSLEHRSKQIQGMKVRQYRENLDTMTFVGILPTTIDTPSNRANMPQSDYSKWTPPQTIAEEIGTWIVNPPLRPHSGSLVKVFHTRHDGHTFDIVR